MQLTILSRRTALLLTILGLLFVARTRAEDAKPASADAMLKQIQDLQAPKFDSDKRSDQTYVNSYIEMRNKWALEKAELEGKFIAAYPESSETPAMRVERWRLLSNANQSSTAAAEAEELLKQPGHENDAGALFFQAMTALNGDDTAKSEAAVDRFINAQPKDERGAQLLADVAENTSQPDKSKAIRQRILRDYPNSSAAKYVKGQIRRSDQLGKPFELSFSDAIGGKTVSMSDLKGKVVVVDFWATWCGPCVGEMPKMKELYAEFKPKGVEFIGVSLDNPESAGGLTKLKDFVAKNDIGWPQYYQGKAWDSEFSLGWGVNSIPCVFVVDADGNLASISARGQLEKLLPELIAKRDTKSADAVH